MRKAFCALSIALLYCLMSPACSSGSTPTQKTASAKDKVLRSYTPVSGCVPNDAKQAIDAIQPRIDEFSDQIARAQGTSRIALSPLLGEMQKTRRDLRAQTLPSCATTVQGFLTEAFDAAIDGLLDFQQEARDSTITANSKKPTSA